jgi:hypothetical protein
MVRLISFLLISSFVGTVVAQGPVTSTTRKRQRGPRAIAVVRWQVDEKGSAHPVLLPVAILDDGKVFDASIYKPSPQPMAVEPGTVYEAQQHGQPIGFFTIGSATHSNAGDHPWLALGTWKTDIYAPQENARQANVVIRTPQAKDLPPVPEGESRRKTTEVYDESGRPADNPGDDEPATMTKGGKRAPVERSPRVATDPKKPAPTTTTDDNDPDRPRLKKGQPTAGANGSTADTAANSPPPSPADNDPNRPVLRRGKPVGETKKDNEAPDAPMPREIIARASVNRPRTYELVAVSDADTNILPQNYTFTATINERQGYLRKMQALVDQELQPKSSGPRNPLRSPKPLSPSRFADMRFELLDVDYNNSPEMVLTGSYVLSATQRIPFVLVARGDYEGNPRELMFQKSDRYEFIDAVDLDGDGPGEFLFRRVGAGGSDFILYRATPDGLTQVFRGGTAE